MERYVIIDNYCGWPKLSLMQDGKLILGVYNKPSHGGMYGEAEVWTSQDGGRSFQFAGFPFKPEPDKSQNNECLGVAHNGDIVEGILNYKTNEKGERRRGPMFSRSSDGGKTFRVTCEEMCMDAVPGRGIVAMFGQIVQVPDTNTLALGFWVREPDDPEDYCRAYACFSDDDGYTWDRCYQIGDGPQDLNNETSLLFFDNNHGIAVCRASQYGIFRRRDSEGKLIPVEPVQVYHDNECLRQYRTRDGGKTWKYEGTVTGAQSHPANLIKLHDGGILLTYGCRFKPFSFTCVQYSSTQGLTWDCPQVLGMYESCDGGYPSSMQNPDGSICTVYYVQAAHYHTHYHIASVVWRPEEIIEDAMLRIDGRGVPSFVRKGAASDGVYGAEPKDVITPDWQFMI